MLLSLDRALRTDGLRTEDVEVPERGVTIRLRMLNSAELDKLEASPPRGGEGHEAEAKPSDSSSSP